MKMGYLSIIIIEKTEVASEFKNFFGRMLNQPTQNESGEKILQLNNI